MIIAFNILITLIAIVIMLYLLEKDLGLFLLSIMIFVQYIWMFFSLMVIESGVHIVEQGRDGYFVYSTLVLLLFFITTIISLIFFKKIFTNFFKNIKVTKIKFGKIKEPQITRVFIGFVFFMAFLNLFLSPIPIFSDNVSKFNFWEHSKFPFLKSIVGNVMAFVAFGSAILFRYYKKTSIFFLILYVSYLLLIGQKFTGFFIGITGALLALYFTSEKKITFKLKWIFNKYLLLFIGAMFFLVLYKYTISNPFRNLKMTPLESVFYRFFGLQGHVFWGTTEQYIYLNKPNTWNIFELWKGMHLLMLEFWPWRYQDFISVTNRGVSWTNAYPSILIRIFPLPIALFANFILVSFLSLMQTLLSIFIKRKSLFISIIFFQLLIWTSYAYTMAYFNKLLIPVFFIFIFFTYKYLVVKTKKE
ncbi:hypothetical protein BTO04_11550 [Polaribacter sp. SA4-10]|uniref:DUF6418 domain-containing protein n=1 Tax=Polaribacter sp. SA4-10 TaxID=754397 RepID=UPI000B3C233D|nr:DUF6418 domain-containing protein [Polaribacter sp. SA4-10]ARV07282.1 hypothetical protein BTO04_11550 [Polaribacter sp. SA4-10]